MAESGYRKIADDGVNRTTARRAIARLRAEGLVVPIKRRGTVVRDTTRVNVPLSRYSAAMTPTGERGPWETACAAQGIEGRTELVLVERLQADADVAGLLDIPAKSKLVHRRRHMWAGSQVAQIQDAWMPHDLVKGTPLDSDQKIVGGVYRALDKIGRPAATVDENVQTRMPTPAEAELMHLDQGSPVLVIQRLTRAADGSPLELLRVVAVGDRVQLVYEGLPLTR